MIEWLINKKIDIKFYFRFLDFFGIKILVEVTFKLFEV